MLFRSRFLRLFLTTLLCLAGCSLIPNSNSPSQMASAQTSPHLLYISSTGGGNHSGTNPKSAGTLEDLPRFIEQVGAGGEIRILSGTYHQNGAIAISKGGSPNQPITIRGANPDGEEVAPPVIVGERADPYQPPPAETGRTLFNLLPGASHLVFRNLECRNQGDGCFVFAGTEGNVTIENVKGTNVRRFIEHAPDRSNPRTAWALENVFIRQVEVRGFSKGVIRFGKPESNGLADAHNIVIDTVLGDSQRQDHDDFCIGVHLRGDVSNVEIRNTVMDNCYQTREPNMYWNGDGFAAEEGTSYLQFIDTSASGNTDAGYDIKASHSVLVRPKASRNKRNYRFWAEIDMREAWGEEPTCWGGTGCKAQVYVTSQAIAKLENCTFVSSDPETSVFQTEDGGQIQVKGGSVQYDGRLKSPPGSNLITLNGVNVVRR